MFEFLRKFSLLMLLFVVALSTYLSAQNATDWQEPLWVTVYPINGDGMETTAAYIESLAAKDFRDIEQFMSSEARRYKVGIDTPVEIKLGPTVPEAPPKPPFNSNILRIAAWSLELRWWTYRVTRHHSGPRPDIKLFLVYFDPNKNSSLEHSVGLQKGRVGIVNVFASRRMAPTNNFVITHEMLHTLGSTDKYAPPYSLPAFPDGYGEPNKMPLYPQTVAELMGGRIMLSETEAVIPESLKDVRIGPLSAMEIRWIK